MAKDQEVLTGVVERIYLANGNRPAKLIVAGAEEAFELTIYPPDGTEQPWDEQTQLPILDNLPTDIVGVTIQAIVGPVKLYNDIPQYKPTQITVLGGNPSPKAAPAAPAQAPKNLGSPTDRDTLIVDQVIFKGAIDLLRGDTTVAKAVSDAILTWEGIRARHLPQPEENPDDDFGSV